MCEDCWEIVRMRERWLQTWSWHSLRTDSSMLWLLSVPRQCRSCATSGTHSHYGTQVWVTWPRGKLDDQKMRIAWRKFWFLSSTVRCYTLDWFQHHARCDWRSSVSAFSLWVSSRNPLHSSKLLFLETLRPCSRRQYRVPELCNPSSSSVRIISICTHKAIMNTRKSTETDFVVKYPTRPEVLTTIVNDSNESLTEAYAIL